MLSSRCASHELSLSILLVEPSTGPPDFVEAIDLANLLGPACALLLCGWLGLRVTANDIAATAIVHGGYLRGKSVT